MTAVAPGWPTFRRWQLARAADDRARFLRCWRRWQRRDLRALIDWGRRLVRCLADLARKLLDAVRPMMAAFDQIARQLAPVRHA